MSSVKEDKCSNISEVDLTFLTCDFVDIFDESRAVRTKHKEVHVSWEDDSLPQWKKGIGFSSKERPSSKLVQPEQPLSKRGRGNKLSPESSSPKTRLDSSFKGRDIIAYDDLF